MTESTFERWLKGKETKWSEFPRVGVGLATITEVVTFVQESISRFIPLIQASGQVVAGTTANTYLLGTQSPVLVVGGNSAQPVQTFAIRAEDVPDLVGFTVKYRVRAQILTNGTAPTGNFTVGLYPITGTSGAAGGVTYAVGPVVPGSAATVISLGANANVVETSLEFLSPPDGLYALGLVTTATSAASSFVHICAQLRRRFTQP